MKLMFAASKNTKVAVRSTIEPYQIVLNTLKIIELKQQIVKVRECLLMIMFKMRGNLACKQTKIEMFLRKWDKVVKHIF